MSPAPDTVSLSWEEVLALEWGLLKAIEYERRRRFARDPTRDTSVLVSLLQKVRTARRGFQNPPPEVALWLVPSP